MEKKVTPFTSAHPTSFSCRKNLRCFEAGTSRGSRLDQLELAFGLALFHFRSALYFGLKWRDGPSCCGANRQQQYRLQHSVSKSRKYQRLFHRSYIVGSAKTLNGSFSPAGRGRRELWECRKLGLAESEVRILLAGWDRYFIRGQAGGSLCPISEVRCRFQNPRSHFRSHANRHSAAAQGCDSDSGLRRVRCSAAAATIFLFDHRTNRRVLVHRDGRWVRLRKAIYHPRRTQITRVRRCTESYYRSFWVGLANRSHRAVRRILGGRVRKVCELESEGRSREDYRDHIVNEIGGVAFDSASGVGSDSDAVVLPLQQIVHSRRIGIAGFNNCCGSSPGLDDAQSVTDNAGIRALAPLQSNFAGLEMGCQSNRCEQPHQQLLSDRKCPAKLHGTPLSSEV